MRIETFSTNEGNFIRGHLIDTKMNDRNWKVANGDKLTQILYSKVPGKDIMLDASKLEKGIDAHYYGNGKKQNIIDGYSNYSHGKYVRVLGPFPMGDGTNDVYYDFIAKLNNSLAASALVNHGSKTKIPFAHSIHIWPLEGPDENITDFDILGGAIVNEGAYGERAVLSKMCNGSAPVCEKSLSATANVMTFADTQDHGYTFHFDPSLAEQIDQKNAQIISSLVSKSASIQTLTMSENPNTNSNADTTRAPIANNPNPNSNPTINPQAMVSTGISVQEGTPTYRSAVEVEELMKAERAKWEKEVKAEVTALKTKNKIIEMNGMIGHFKNEKSKKEMMDKYTKENVDMDVIKSFLDDYKKLEAEEKATLEAANQEQIKEKSKGKSASTSSSDLPKEPIVPESSNNNNNKDKSKVASVLDNKVKVISDFLWRGR